MWSSGILVGPRMVTGGTDLRFRCAPAGQTQRKQAFELAALSASVCCHLSVKIRLINASY